MTCPTCGHPMHDIGHGSFWCTRCGTINAEDDGVHTPMLVGRCRRFATYLTADLAAAWHRIGIRESVNRPEDRP